MDRQSSHEVETFAHWAKSLGVPFVNLHEYSISPGLLRKLPRQTMRAFRCVAMVFNRRRIVLVLDDPAHALFLTSDPTHLGWFGPSGLTKVQNVEFALTTPSALDETMARRDELPA